MSQGQGAEADPRPAVREVSARAPEQLPLDLEPNLEPEAGRRDEAPSLQVVRSVDLPDDDAEAGSPLRSDVARDLLRPLRPVPVGAVVVLPNVLKGSNPETQRVTRGALFSGRALPLRSLSGDGDVGGDPLAVCLDEHGRIDVSVAVQLLAAQVHEPPRRLVLALADTFLSLTEAAEDLVRLLNRSMEHLLGVGLACRPLAVAETAVVAATLHLGPVHPSTLTARANLAVGYQSAGRTAEALALFERVLADRERLLGSDHPEIVSGSTGRRGRDPDPEKVTAALQRLHLDACSATRGAVFSGRSQPPGPSTTAGQTGIDLLRLCVDGHGRLDVDLVAHVLSEEVPASRRPVALALVDTIRSLAEAVEDLAGLDNRATEHLLGIGGAYHPVAAAEAALVAARSHLGAQHPATLTARANLAHAHQAAGRTPEALSGFEQVLAGRERLLGPDHDDTLTARANLALSHQEVGRAEEARAGFERVMADCERLLGPLHPDTLTARSNLASSYQATGRTARAITGFERVLADSERLLGALHPDTLTARANLAASYHTAGRTAEALAAFERGLADRRQLLGPDHPRTLAARAALALAYQTGGRTARAVACFERVLADRTRILGPEHPDTSTTRGNLAVAYRSAGRDAEALALFEQVVADRERLLGPEHPKTLTACANLAASYQSAARPADALTLCERVVAGRERLLGVDHPRTRTARGNLAVAYRAVGRTAKASAIFKRMVADCERLLGPDDPETVAARAVEARNRP